MLKIGCSKRFEWEAADRPRTRGRYKNTGISSNDAYNDLPFPYPKTSTWTEQKPVKTGKTSLIAQVADRLNLLFDCQIDRIVKSDVLELAFDFVDLEKIRNCYINVTGL